MIKLKDRFTERPVFVKKDRIESIQKCISGEEEYSEVVMESGSRHNVQETVGEIMEMED